jgi:hypothetical protein
MSRREEENKLNSEKYRARKELGCPLFLPRTGLLDSE